MKKHKQAKAKTKSEGSNPIREREPNAAGIDMGASEIWVAVPTDRSDTPVRRFEGFTRDLMAIVQWLIQCGVRSVAMESTGVYWIPLFQLLEANGVRFFAD
jgi:transposase